ncbi:MAG: hypothetical protein OHK0057_08580 [Thermoflexibacter sp.]
MKKEVYKRNLPHIQPIGATFFVTCNLFGSLPSPLLEKWKEEYEIQKAQIQAKISDANLLQDELDKLSKLDFKKRDSFLDTTKNGNHYFKSPILAKIVADSLHFWDSKRLELICYCIMSNHVHTVFRLFEEQEAEGRKIYLEDIMHSIKLFSARECNKVLGKEGQFWQNESYDRMVRERNEL